MEEKKYSWEKYTPDPYIFSSKYHYFEPVDQREFSNDLEKCLNLFTWSEQLNDSENLYNCENCGPQQEAIKRILLLEAPKYLVITLKRFI